MESSKLMSKMSFSPPQEEQKLEKSGNLDSAKLPEVSKTNIL